MGARPVFPRDFVGVAERVSLKRGRLVWLGDCERAVMYYTEGRVKHMNYVARIAAVAFALVLGACASSEQQKEAKAAEYACAQINAPKVAAPFYENVHAARPSYRTVSRTRAFENKVLAGAELDMRATPGMTTEFLQRALACNAVAKEQAFLNDPLHPSGTVDGVAVRSTGAGFTVTVTSNDSDTARDILRRSEALVGEGGRVDVRQIGWN